MVETFFNSPLYCSIMNSSVSENQLSKLIEDGFCIFKNILDDKMIRRIDEAANRLLALEEDEHFKTQKSTGSLIPIHRDSLFAELVVWPKAIEAIRSMGFNRPVFSSGYVISKPPYSPPLFWHQDWWGWNEAVSYQKFPQQVFLMYYLVNTRPENGCLRLIPGSHIKHHPLHEATPAAHTNELTKVANPNHPAFQYAEGEVDVCVQAGDVVIGDSRILHSAHPNRTNQRRTVITLWYLPLFYELPDSIRSFLARQNLREGWSIEAQRMLQPFDPIYTGPRLDLETEWNRIPGLALKRR